ncbi:MAG: signal peptidase I [Ruminococcus sp.]|nr:signal peptidase I [Ruminococcus sp.]
MRKYRQEQRPSVAEIEGELTRLKEKKSRNNGIRFIAVLSVLAAAMIIILTNLWFPVLRVVGSSMQPLLKNDDIILCLNTQSGIERGDIIAFYQNDRVLLKRVVGMPGDMVDIDASGVVSINGEEQKESYASVLSLEPCDIEFPIEVPENSYFVLGDQRTTSMDSRSESVGMVTPERIIGKALLRAWPIDRFRGI